VWFENAAPAMARMPFVMAHGNHDGLAINYLVQFAQPQADAPDQDELYFSMDYGPVHLVVLNDTPRGGDLSSGRRGPRSSRGSAATSPAPACQPRPGALDHRGAPQALLRLVACTPPRSTRSSSAARGRPCTTSSASTSCSTGHEHDFELSKELDGTGHEVSGRRGTLYIVAAGAGAELYEARQRAWTRYSESVVNFLLVHATNRALEVTPHRGDGTVITQGRVMLTPRPM
jgi:hypothetical protein